jgi:hypothetical protein
MISVSGQSGAVMDGGGVEVAITVTIRVTGMICVIDMTGGVTIRVT